VLDSARDGLSQANLDELNRIEPGANFGWPYCIGADNHADVLQGDFNCTDAVAPVFTFPTHSHPLGIASYDSDTFPGIKGDLLVTLGGSNEQTHIEGYMLVALAIDSSTGLPTASQIIIPKQSPRPNESNLQSAHYQGSGFWPHRPLDVAVSQEGWIYVSAGGGTIYVIRPL
jgi:glucose/arabinose dehydrogenase